MSETKLQLWIYLNISASLQTWFIQWYFSFWQQYCWRSGVLGCDTVSLGV